MEKHPERDFDDPSGSRSGSAFVAFPGLFRGPSDVGIGLLFGRIRDRLRTNIHALQGMTNPGCLLLDPCVVQRRPGTYKGIERRAQADKPTYRSTDPG
jgi:hypothetical protein